MARTTPLSLLADALLVGGLDQFVVDRRRQGMSWRQVAEELRNATDGKAGVTQEAIRAWFPEDRRTPGSELTEKPCRTCGAVKPLDEFSPMATGRGGRSARCKACLNVASNERRRSESSNHRLVNEARRLAMQDLARERRAEYLQLYKARKAQLVAKDAS